MFAGCELRGIAVLNTVFVLVSWEHSVGCCVADTVLAEFWGNMAGNTTNLLAGFPASADIHARRGEWQLRAQPVTSSL